MVENASGRRLKTLRTDNGGEYTAGKFQEHLKQHGIRHETTVPKNPEQNGTAERMNRTLVETVRSMLADAQLPKRFWAEALETATYLRNRSPAKSLDQMTPFEAWTGRRPDIRHLRVFGCTAYAHIPRDERGKLDSKTRTCWLMGYGDTTKGYRLYDRTRLTVFYSRDVTCDEGVREECPHQGSLNTEVDEDEVFQKKQVEDERVSGGEEDEKPPSEATRYPQRVRAEPKRYGEWENYMSEDPGSLTEALSSPKSE